METDLRVFSDIFKGLSYAVIFIGPANAGKSALIYRYILDEVPGSMTATVALEFTKKNIEGPGGAALQLHIWDTAGQERFKSVTKHHYRGADACLVVFDVTDKGSFAALPSWLSELRESTDAECQVYLVGNKLDLERRVSRGEAAAFAKAESLPYYETSSLWSRSKPLESDKSTGGIESIFNLIVVGDSHADLIKLHSDRTRVVESANHLTGTFCTPADRCLC